MVQLIDAGLWAAAVFPASMVTTSESMIWWIKAALQPVPAPPAHPPLSTATGRGAGGGRAGGRVGWTVKFSQRLAWHWFHCCIGTAMDAIVQVVTACGHDELKTWR